MVTRLRGALPRVPEEADPCRTSSWRRVGRSSGRGGVQVPSAVSTTRWNPTERPPGPFLGSTSAWAWHPLNGPNELGPWARRPDDAMGPAPLLHSGGLVVGGAPFTTSASCTNCYPYGVIPSRAGGDEARPTPWPPGSRRATGGPDPRMRKRGQRCVGCGPRERLMSGESGGGAGPIVSQDATSTVAFDGVAFSFEDVLGSSASITRVPGQPSDVEQPPRGGRRTPGVHALRPSRRGGEDPEGRRRAGSGPLLPHGRPHGYPVVTAARRADVTARRTP